jgi:hypothetical protein
VGYISECLQFLSTGKSITDWKFDHPSGNNIDESIPADLIHAWRQEASTPVTISGSNKLDISFTNNLTSLYLGGAKPVNNCLHYGYGSNQHGVVGLFNADTKMVWITNKNGSPVGNAVIRLASNAGRPAVVLEPLYSSENNSHASRELHRATVVAAADYAASLGIQMHVSNQEVFGKETLQAAREMYGKKLAWESVLLMPTLAPFTYTDTNGISEKQVHVNTLRLPSARINAA